MRQVIRSATNVEMSLEERGKRVQAADENDIRAGYDPEKTRQALREGFGALKGIDREEFLREIYAARGQDSKGRPA